MNGKKQSFRIHSPHLTVMIWGCASVFNFLTNEINLIWLWIRLHDCGADGNCSRPLTAICADPVGPGSYSQNLSLWGRQTWASDSSCVFRSFNSMPSCFWVDTFGDLGLIWVAIFKRHKIPILLSMPLITGFRNHTVAKSLLFSLLTFGWLKNLVVDHLCIYLHCFS